MQTSSKAISSLRVVALILWATASFQACGEDNQQENSPPSCGPGTALVNGQCVVAAECGEGTVLKEGKCVPDTTAGQGGAGGSQGGNGGSNAAQGGAQAGGSSAQTGGSEAGGVASGGTTPGGSGGNLGGSGGNPTAGSAGAEQAGNGGSDAGSGSESGGAGQGGMSGNSDTGGSSGSASAGESGQGGTDGGTGGISAGGTNQAGNGGVSGAAGNQAGQGGNTPDDMDDPCPSEPIDFNCDPACGDVHPGCATIGCDGKVDFGPTYKTKILIRTPSNPTPDPACTEKCTSKTPYTLIMIGLPKFTGFDFWYEKFSNVTGGWVMSQGSDHPYDKCMFQSQIYYSKTCYSVKDFAVYGDVKIFYGASPTLRARNIVIERSTDQNIPLTCP